MKAAMLFPGQASQYVGMGKDYYDAFSTARELYKEANHTLGFDITELSFTGDLEELTKTKNAQPAILLHSLVVLAVLGAHRIEPSIVAGHSLGEFSALVAAGFFRPMDALLIVRRRGELMYDAGLERPGTMAAFIGLDEKGAEESVRQASEDGVVVVANYNSPNQFAVSGEIGAVERAMEIAREMGAKRVMPLQVSGAFHSPLMEQTEADLRSYISRFERGRLSVPWVANVTGGAVTDREEVLELLCRQLSSPVRWTECMHTFASRSNDEIFEVGPGKVLSGLMKRIEPSRTVTPLTTVDGLEGMAKRPA